MLPWLCHAMSVARCNEPLGRHFLYRTSGLAVAVGLHSNVYNECTVDSSDLKCNGRRFSRPFKRTLDGSFLHTSSRGRCESPRSPPLDNSFDLKQILPMEGQFRSIPDLCLGRVPWA